MDYHGNDIKSIANVVSVLQCQDECRKTNRCVAFTYNIATQVCFLKDKIGNERLNYEGISGDRYCQVKNGDKEKRVPQFSKNKKSEIRTY